MCIEMLLSPMEGITLKYNYLDLYLAVFRRPSVLVALVALVALVRS
jgi:hypothetical protein